jgi:hypothetical protein
MRRRSACHFRRGHARSATILPQLAAAVLVTAGCGIAVTAQGRPWPQASGTATAVNPAGPEGAVTVARDGASGKTVQMQVGDRLELILSSDYWTVRGSSAPAVLRQDGPSKRLPRPGTCSEIPGLGCTPLKTSFTALAAGTAVITARRTTCGEALRCVGDRGRFIVTVVVR